MELKGRICSSEVSPARTLPTLGQRKALRKAHEAAYGLNTPKQFAYYDRNSHSLKTAQSLLSGDLKQSLATLPRWGMMQNGVCYRLKAWVLRTKEHGVLFYPTPQASDSKGGSDKCSKAKMGYLKYFLHRTKSKWTMKTASGKSSYPNPMFVEWLMGFPITWTELPSWGMRYVRKSHSR